MPWMIPLYCSHDGFYKLYELSLVPDVVEY